MEIIYQFIIIQLILIHNYHRTRSPVHEQVRPLKVPLRFAHPHQSATHDHARRPKNSKRSELIDPDPKRSELTNITYNL